MNPVPMSEELTDVVLAFLAKAHIERMGVTKSRRWHEYEEDEPLPDLSEIFKNRPKLDFKAEDSGGPWLTVTRKKKIR